MASLLTASELRDRIGEDYYLSIADRDGDGVVDAGDQRPIDAALARATSHAYSLLGVVFGVPLDDDVTDALRGAVADIAVYYATPTGDAVTDEVRNRYRDAERWCMSVSKRMATLGGATEPTERITPVHDGDARQFDTASMESLL